MNLKMYAVALIAVVCAFVAGKYSGPAKVETREVEKIVYREKVDEKKNVSISSRTKEITLPNGTVVKTTIVDTHEATEKHTDIQVDKEREVTRTETSQPDWRLGVTYTPPLVTFQAENYTLGIERRLFSSIYVGLAVSTQKTIGISFSIGF